MKDFFGMIVAALLDFKWLVLGVLFGALMVGAVIDARAADPVAPPPALLNPTQCQTMSEIMGALAGARDHGIKEDMAQDILDKANTGAQDELPAAAMPFLHLMTHRMYEHPEWPPEAVQQGNYNGCMKVWKKYHPGEEAPPAKEVPWTPFSYGRHNT